MTMTLRCHALNWYMKFSVVLVGIPHKKLDQIRMRLLDEFKKPNSESRCITKSKEIKKLPTESVWDFN